MEEKPEGAGDGPVDDGNSGAEHLEQRHNNLPLLTVGTSGLPPWIQPYLYPFHVSGISSVRQRHSSGSATSCSSNRERFSLGVALAYGGHALTDRKARGDGYNLLMLNMCSSTLPFIPMLLVQLCYIFFFESRLYRSLLRLFVRVVYDLLLPYMGELL